MRLHFKAFNPAENALGRGPHPQHQEILLADDEEPLHEPAGKSGASLPRSLLPPVRLPHYRHGLLVYLGYCPKHPPAFLDRFLGLVIGLYQSLCSAPFKLPGPVSGGITGKRLLRHFLLYRFNLHCRPVPGHGRAKGAFPEERQRLVPNPQIRPHH